MIITSRFPILLLSSRSAWEGCVQESKKYFPRKTSLCNLTRKTHHVQESVRKNPELLNIFKMGFHNLPPIPFVLLTYSVSSLEKHSIPSWWQLHGKDCEGKQVIGLLVQTATNPETWTQVNSKETSLRGDLGPSSGRGWRVHTPCDVSFPSLKLLWGITS